MYMHLIMFKYFLMQYLIIDIILFINKTDLKKK